MKTPRNGQVDRSLGFCVSFAKSAFTRDISSVVWGVPPELS